MAEMVFYSWQSDLPNRCNRGLIQRALEQAVGDLNREADLEAAPRVDHDTAGVPGSPDIGEAIFEKIDNASAFVADVSLLPNSEGRVAPNPNVLIELGYALKALGWRRVILVVNTHFGPIEELPFDLRRKRALSYRLDPDTAAAEERRALRAKLAAALRQIFEGELQRARQEILGGYGSEVATEVISFLLLAEQMEDRSLNPWFDTAQHTFAVHTERFRELAMQPEAEELEAEQVIRSLAGRIDIVAQHISAMGRENWQEYLEKVASAVETAAHLKAKLFGQGGLDPDSVAAALAQVEKSQRVVSNLSAEAQEAMAADEFPHQWKRLRNRASEEGEKLLRISYYPLPRSSINVNELRTVGKSLHQLELLAQRTMGRETIDRCLESIVTLSGQLAALRTAAL